MADVQDGSLWLATTDFGSGGNILHFTEVDPATPPPPPALGSSYLNVMDPAYGVVGDGVTDDWAALNAARDAAASAGKLLYFPKRIYGIGDRFYFADGGDPWFEPGATLKLLAETVSGGAVSGPYPTQTKPITVHNLTIDCNNIPGENGIGFGHKVGAFFHNLTIKNVLHSTTRLGGKALQWEGTEAIRGYVNGLNLENCSIGIDIGAHHAEQSVNIGIFNVTMRDVDIPVHVNDTNLTQPADSRDSIEVLIDGIQGRNCGAITWAGGTPHGGGLFVMDRGYGVTIRNYQFVNDRGGFSSTAYDTIGAVVRGKGKGLILENGLVVANATSLFDYRASTIQSPAGYDIASYVLADGLRHYGNLDYIIKGANAANIGPGKMGRIEIGSTLATLAGIVEPTIATATSAFLEVIDRDNGFKTTGLRSLKDLYDMGNAVNSLTAGAVLPQASGLWYPTDASGAGLSVSGEGILYRHGGLVTLLAQVTYPTTSNTLPAYIGGFPIPVMNHPAARAGGYVTTATNGSTARRLFPVPGGTHTPILDDASNAITNAACSGATISIVITYPA